MNRRERTMSNEMYVKGTYILTAYKDYKDGIFYVNRKYQRKLVWTLEEKQYFIDTLLHKYPVPLFLLNKYKLKSSDAYRKDIVDGLQRLNAIFSFIENEFPVKRPDGNLYYFNPATILLPEGCPVHTNVLPIDLCWEFLNYELPFFVTEASDTDIEDIFIRINSSGRKLSQQDLRQAGAVGAFSDLVRQTATYIRGDITETDDVLLNMMPAISISNTSLPYEINVKDIFWVKNKIITEKNIRESRDEEIIARIYSYMLLGDKVSTSSRALSNMYNSAHTYNKELERIVKDKGVLELMDTFSKVLSDIVSVFDSCNSTFSETLFSRSDVTGKSKVFQALFMALYDMRMEGRYIEDFSKVCNLLYKVGDKEFSEITTDYEWNVKSRNVAIRRIRSILEPGVPLSMEIAIMDEWNAKMDKLLLSALGTEQQMFDFKIGLLDIVSGIPSTSVLNNIVKTITAMMNTYPKRVATVIIGIADNKDDAIKYEKKYNTNSVKFKDCYITGVDCEIQTNWKSLDELIQYMTNTINSQPVSETVKSHILTNIKPIRYKGKTLIVIECAGSDTPVSYAQKFYERRGNSAKEVPTDSTAFSDMFNRFKQM